MNNRFSRSSDHEERKRRAGGGEDGGIVGGGDDGDVDGGSYEGVELSPIKGVVKTQLVDRGVDTRDIVRLFYGILLITVESKLNCL